MAISPKNPARLLFFLKTIFTQKKAVKLRQKWQAEGIHVPPFMIFSITHQCNLKCRGCYRKSQSRLGSVPAENEINSSKFSSILRQAGELGISIALISGGEPLMRKDLLGITSGFPDIIFILFTNGLLINEKNMLEFKKQKNIIPVISIEGDKLHTDNRRGEGVFENAKKIYREFKSNNIFFGASVTVTSENYEPVFKSGFIEESQAAGCRLFFFVDYVPVAEGTEHLVITEIQRNEINATVEKLNLQRRALFISFPGGEELYGGCLAAGRGFIHVNADGKVEPCPFAPYSDADLNTVSLKESLKSNLLKVIRENHSKLKESKGGCALWENRQWLESLQKHG